MADGMHHHSPGVAGVEALDAGHSGCAWPLCQIWIHTFESAGTVDGKTRSGRIQVISHREDCRRYQVKMSSIEAPLRHFMPEIARQMAIYVSICGCNELCTANLARASSPHSATPHGPRLYPDCPVAQSKLTAGCSYFQTRTAPFGWCH